jgi:hypothetical protein
MSARSRRDFLIQSASGLCAAAACLGTHDIEAQGASEIVYAKLKGQFAYIPETPTQWWISKPKAKEGQMAHLGFLAIRKRAVGAPRPGSPEPIGDWWVWPLPERLQFGGADPAPVRGPAPSSGIAQPCPERPGDDEYWRDTRWIADMKKISQGSKLWADWKTNPRKYHDFLAPLIPRTTLVGRAPFKAEEQRAIWKFVRPNGTSDRVLNQSITDHVWFAVRFPRGTAAIELLRFDQDAASRSSNSLEGTIKLTDNAARGEPIEVLFLSAPPKHGQRKGAMVSKVTDFQLLYNLLENPSNAMPELAEECHAKGQTKKPQKPIETKDNDIFCPGSLMPTP